MVKVTLKDARSLKYCKEGMVQFCADHGLSWDEAKRDGIDSDVLLSLQDAMADALVAEAERRNG